MTSNPILLHSPDPGAEKALRQALHPDSGAEIKPLGGEAGAPLTRASGRWLVLDLWGTVDRGALQELLNPDVPPMPLAQVERLHIERVLRHTRGNKRQAALLLGIARSTLQHRVRSHRPQAASTG